MGMDGPGCLRHSRAAEKREGAGHAVPVTAWLIVGADPIRVYPLRDCNRQCAINKSRKEPCVTTTKPTSEPTRTLSPRTLALVSLIVAPLTVLIAGVALVLAAPEWAKTTPDGGNLLTLLLAGVSGGLIVALVARRRLPSLLIAPLLGAVVAVGFRYLVFDNTDIDLSILMKVLLVYAPVQGAAYFLAVWLPQRG